MPLTQNPIVEWPAELSHLLEGIEIATGPDGKRFGRIDVDVDRETLFLVNDFEARNLPWNSARWSAQKPRVGAPATLILYP